jgi:hypothetical protein
MSSIQNLRSVFIFAFALPYDSIRPRQYIRGNRHADLLGGREIDDKLKLRRLLDGNVSGLCAFQYLVHKVCGAPPLVR